jgi:hypothetical protein
MNGPRSSPVQPEHRRGRHLLPLLVAMLWGPLACSHDQPTENTLRLASGSKERLHPYLTVPDTGAAGTFQTSPAVSFNLGIAALGPENGPKVLLLADADGPSTAALANSLAKAGYQVTSRPAPENTWNGTNPALTDFKAVIHLDGATWAAPLPAAGQSALTSFVHNGGGYIGNQWIGYEAAIGQQTGIPNLVLQGYGNSGKEQECGNCSVTYTAASGQASHPLLAGLPASFTFPADGHHAGPMIPFLIDPSTLLMRVPSGNPGVIARRYGRGKVVNFSVSPNYGLGGSGRTLHDANVQRLFLNAVRWSVGAAEEAQPQSISFAPLSGKTFGDPDFTLSALATSGLPVTFTASGQCTISSATVHLTGAGTCTINAEQGGNNAFKAAEPVSQSFAIAKATPAIRWADPAPILLGTQLSKSQLNASATGVGGTSLAGSFVYDPAAGTVLGMGSHSLGVQFTPADQNYTGASKTVQIAVVYRFSGFFQPVDNMPVVNTAKAGSAIPVKFSLGGNQGLAIMGAGSPSSIPVSCVLARVAGVDAIEETVAASTSGLRYTGNRYQYNWKTSASWAGSCRKLRITLVDGTTHELLFRFR